MWVKVLKQEAAQKDREIKQAADEKKEASTLTINSV
jgi:hypothetical protein